MCWSDMNSDSSFLCVRCLVVGSPGPTALACGNSNSHVWVVLHYFIWVEGLAPPSQRACTDTHTHTVRFKTDLHRGSTLDNCTDDISSCAELAPPLHSREYYHAHV